MNNDEIIIDQRLPLPPTIKGVTYGDQSVDLSGSDSDDTSITSLDTIDGGATAAITAAAYATYTTDVAAAPAPYIQPPSAITVRSQNVTLGSDGSAVIQLVIDVTGSSTDIDYEVRVVAT